jgi:hypothetical protein
MKVVEQREIVLVPHEKREIRLEFALEDFPDPPCVSRPVQVSGMFLQGFERSEFVPDDPSDCGLADRPLIWVDLSAMEERAPFDGEAPSRILWKREMA